MPSLIHSQGTLRQCRKFANVAPTDDWQVTKRCEGHGKSHLGYYVCIHIYTYSKMPLNIYIYIILYRHIHIILFYTYYARKGNM